MKNLILGLLISGFSLTALAVAPQYECGDLEGHQEYNILIDVENKKATFEDKRSFVLNLSGYHATKSKYILEFTGTDQVNGNVIRLVFNVNRKFASVTSTAVNGSINYMGKTFCEEVNPWD